MGWTWIPHVSAAGLAIILSGVELFAARRKPPSIKAAHWICYRFACDGSTAVLAFVLLGAALEGLKWFTGPWPVLLAGLVGPALLRSQLAILGSGSENSYYGPAKVYARLQGYINQQIDDIGSVEQSRWVRRCAVPQLCKVPLSEVRECVVTYLNGLDRMSAAERKKTIAALDGTVDDPNFSHQEKVGAIVALLIDVGGRRQVKMLMKAEFGEAAENPAPAPGHQEHSATR
ncbi:hypothetical protein [Nonomuraea typhae]|uniref:hypothetical protein n=1 Tax=Nonomuraea typhae TaxID=2603600 RepID=UPI0012FC00E9|nr:hypothetical protein [Nonomuraea typhae]